MYFISYIKKRILKEKIHKYASAYSSSELALLLLLLNLLLMVVRKEGKGSSELVQSKGHSMHFFCITHVALSFAVYNCIICEHPKHIQ